MRKPLGFRWRTVVSLVLMAAPGHPALPRIRVEIQPTQGSVKPGEDLAVLTTVRNVGSDELSLRMWSCSYGDQWDTDNPGVQTNHSSCNKNGILRVALKPGQTYERQVAVRVATPCRASDSSVVFRLGFAEADSGQPLSNSRVWSNAASIALKCAPRGSKYFRPGSGQ